MTEQKVAQKYLEKYRELEKLALKTFFPGVGYYEKDVQERIRTMALVKEIVDAEE